VIHIGAKTEPDPFNKKLKWALMQMDWLVKKVYTQGFARQVL
jgi:hypothetical protein